MISLSYVSRSRIGGDIGTLIDIWDNCQDNNRKRRITGALYCDNYLFFQVLEGTAYSVARTFRSICRDRRHTDIRLLSGHGVSERIFGNWHMKIVNAMSDEALPQRFNRDRIVNGGQRYLDARIEEMLAY